MRLLFTGNFPVWLVLTLALAGTVVIWRFYRRQSLPHPWRFVLPLVRLAALGLLLLALLQPVVSRHSKTTVRGRLAVVVDDSGSMSIADTYRPAETVRTAWQLALFPRDERSVAVEQARSQAAESQRRTTELAGEIERVLLPASSGQTAVPLRRGIHRLTQGAERMLRDARNLHDSLAAALAQTGYLSQAETPPVKGRLLYERYENIDGWQVSDLASAAHYPDRPDASAMPGRFAMPENAGERYGARIRAILSPPVSGEFVFWLAADDQAVLWLSDGATPANKREIARVPQWVPREVYDMYPEQQSEPIVLHKGEHYYIEAVLKENLGDDHCTVGWKRPDGRREFPIPGVYFSPVDQTVERKRFDRAYRRVQADLAGEIEAWEGLTETIEGLPPTRDAAAAEVATVREAMRQSFALRAAAWRRLVDDLAGLQKLADEALAAAGVESVDTALRKLAGMSRLELARHLLLKGTLKLDKLEALGEVDIFLLDEPPQAISTAEFADRSLQATRDSTRLGSVIHGIVEHYADRPVAAILALTDGNINAGRSPSDLANYLSERDIRMLCVGVGRVEPPADVAIDQVIAPRTSFQGDRLTFTILLRRHGYAHRPIRISVAGAGETLLTHTLPPGDDEIVSFELSFVEARDGYQHYVVEAENMGGEALADNNRKAVSVNILTDPVRVLLLDQYPRWETRFVKLMMTRDPRVEAEVVFLGNAPFAEGDDALRPALSRERLFALDILVLGDVPAHAFAPEELADIRRFVVERGGCLLLLAGPHHLPRSYRQSVLADILPLRVIPQTPVAGEPSRPPSGEHRLSLTEAGGHSAAVQMAPTGSENELLWRELPPMNWLVEGVLPTPNAEVLVVAGDDRQAVALAGHAGLGRVLFLGADSFWRWRYRAGWRFHQRLWNQIFLWATVGRTSGIDEHVKLIADRAEYSPGESVVLRARVLGRDKLPLEGVVVAATIVNEAGEPVKSVRFTHLPNSGGEYRAQVTDLAKGAYVAVPRIRELEGVPIEADYPFEIRDMPTSEYIDLALDEGTLAMLGDHYWHFLEAEKALEHIPRIQLVETRRRDSEIWNTGWLLALLVALLGFEWQMRKKFNLP